MTAAERRQSRSLAVNRGQAPKIVLQRIAIEKAQTPYIHLMCDCITTVETQEIYAVWRPKRGKLYCETHGRWVNMKPKPKLADNSEPMF